MGVDSGARGHASAAAGSSAGAHSGGHPPVRTAGRAEPIGLGIVLVGLVVILSIAATDRTRVEAAGVRSAIETLISLMALVSAGLVGFAVRRSGRLQDLLVLVSLATVALIDFTFNALPSIGQYELGVDGMGARIAGMLLATAAFAAAALAPRDLRVSRAWPRLLGFALLGGLAVVAGSEALEAVLGTARTTSIQAYRPAVAFAATISSLGLLTAAGLFIVRRRDALGPLLASAAFLLAVVGLQRMFLPVESSRWVTPADIVRAAAYGVLLLVAGLLYREARAAIAAEALASERSRIAHDLHDGLAQDLALIAVHGEGLAHTLGATHPVVVAAQRALNTSRGEILELVAEAEPCVETAVRRLAADLARRYDVIVEVTVAPDRPDFSPVERADLLRIAQEAIVNAVHHGRARVVSLTLGSRRSGMLLRVVDDGCGVGSPPAQASRGTGLGLPMMQMRAGRLGAELRARRRGDSGGTAVEIVVASPAARPETGRRRRRRLSPAAGAAAVWALRRTSAP